MKKLTQKEMQKIVAGCKSRLNVVNMKSPGCKCKCKCKCKCGHKHGHPYPKKVDG